MSASVRTLRSCIEIVDDVVIDATTSAYTALLPIVAIAPERRDDGARTHPLAHFSNAECRAWIATLVALRAYPARMRQRPALRSAP